MLTNLDNLSRDNEDTELSIVKEKLIKSVYGKMSILRKSLEPLTIEIVSLSRNLFAIIDKDMASEINRFTWHCNVQPEYIHGRRKFEDEYKTLQRYIAEIHNLRQGYTDPVKQVSFKNKITLDCRISNLNIGYGRQAVMRHRTAKRNTTSKFKGVYRGIADERIGKWRAVIADTKSGLGQVFLGHFESETEAACVYDAAATFHFGKSAYLNFGGDGISDDHLQYVAARFESHKLRKKAKIENVENSKISDLIPKEIRSEISELNRKRHKLHEQDSDKYIFKVLFDFAFVVKGVCKSGHEIEICRTSNEKIANYFCRMANINGHAQRMKRLHKMI